MKIEKQQLDDLNAVIKLTIEKSDYEDSFNTELKNYKKKVQLKGFRKGKTPLSSIKKMYGKSVLLDVVNNTLQEKLSAYLVEEKLDILGNPIPSTDQEQMDIDIKDLKDFNFSFDIGLAPNIEVKGVSGTDEYLEYDIQIPEKLLQEELDMRRKRFGKQVNPETDIVEDDLILIKASELDGSTIKDKGHQTGFSMLVSRIGDDDIKKKVLGGKVGETFDFDINTIEKDVDEKYVKKYLLNLDDDEEKEIGKNFKGEIEKITRVELAELDQDFFDSAFGKDKVKSESEAKNSIKDELGAFYEKQQKSLVYRGIMDALIEKNQMELPESFLKRWLSSNNPDVKSEDIEKEYEGFEKNLRWSLVKSKLAKDHNIEVSPEELRESVKKKIMSYMAQYQQSDFDVEPMINNYLGNREQVEKEYEEAMAEKLFDDIYNKVKLKPEKISIEDFREKVQEINKAINPA